VSRFDVVLGHYVYCSQHYAGQGDPLYEKLCRITRYFNPGAAFSETKFFREPEYEAARAVYDHLCETHKKGNA